MDLISIPTFQDNYIWLLSDHSKRCVIVDPGKATPVLTTLRRQQLTPDAILLTHHHQDHVGGVLELIAYFPGIPVYGPQETASKGTNIIVRGGDDVIVNGHHFTVIAVPGHTIGHISYYNAPYLFCGDTLFSAGCGRLFEGSPEQMFNSIQQLMLLPDNTLICSAHEYTLLNLEFARSILPTDHDIETYQQQVKKLREKNQPSLPTTLQLERKINLFLRCNDIDLQRKLGVLAPPNELSSVFSALRALRDHF